MSSKLGTFPLDSGAFILYSFDVQSSDQDNITAAEAAELIGVTPQAVRDLIRKGELPGWWKISAAANSPYLGPRASVLAYLQRKQTKSTK